MAITVSGANLVNGKVGVYYAQFITFSGASCSCKFKPLSGSLPRGVTLTYLGLVSGTPEEAGKFNFSVRATEDKPNGAYGDADLSVTFATADGSAPPLSISINPPVGQVGVLYDYQCVARNGAEPYAWEVLSGSMPTGVTLSATGRMYGTPEETGYFTPTLRVTSGGDTATYLCFIQVNAAPSGDGGGSAPGDTTDIGGGGDVVGGGSIYSDIYAAGVAFCEIRRVDEKGVQLSTPSSHSMTVMVSKGLTGWTWTGAGVRTELPGCTNPTWVTVNTYLRALGLSGASESTQEEHFDVVAAAASAAIADTEVVSLFGSATEKQFRFCGSVDAQKPTRDWIRDILNNQCGYFTWSFGKLKIGSRIDATPVTTFDSSNMLWGSLRLEPVKPQFEKLTVEFADTEYLFAKNTVDYTDQDHAARNGRVQNPLASKFGLVGCSTKSQAARIAVIRTREELGGVGVTEQRNARIASWKSTILALDTEAGMVVRASNTDIPGGFGDFRIQSWRLNRDWSVDIVGRTVTATMYNMAAGVVPASVTEKASMPSSSTSTEQLFTVNGT